MTQPAPGVEMTLESEGLFCHLSHGPSGTRIRTEPPKDNGGTGSTFSPTDLVGAALAACAVTTMALAAKRDGVAWGEAKARVVKRMSGAPRRIAELELHIRMPKELPAGERARFEEIARGCPVARSLGEVRVPMTFEYE